MANFGRFLRSPDASQDVDFTTEEDFGLMMRLIIVKIGVVRNRKGNSAGNWKKEAPKTQGFQDYTAEKEALEPNVFIFSQITYK